jgi:hypothetical protein
VFLLPVQILEADSGLGGDGSGGGLGGDDVSDFPWPWTVDH